ncbi:MAG: lysophospholipid acyltransferase family protein [Planctomycetota bacterium]
MASLIAGKTLGLLRLTYVRQIFNDHRDRIVSRTGRQYVYAILHAHQVAALSMSEAKCGAMVSRSEDGELVVPALKACSLVPIRGSSGTGRKGGATALVEMIRHVRAGHSAVVAVDGPKGPRGRVQPGAAMVAHKANVPVIPVVLIPRRRVILRNSWDRLQLLVPFTNLRVHFGDPIYPRPDQFADGRDSIADMGNRIEQSLRNLEAQFDPEEYKLAANNNNDVIRQKVAPKTFAGSTSHAA